jgi:hypothetical protein
MPLSEELEAIARIIHPEGWRDIGPGSTRLVDYRRYQAVMRSRARCKARHIHRIMTNGTR